MTTAPAEGFLFTPPEGDYSIVFAAEPTANPQEVQLPNGTPETITFYLHETRDLAQGTASITYGPDVVPSLEGARDGAVEALNGATLTSSEPISQQGRSGLQFVADLQPSGTDGTYVARIFLDGQTLYQVIYRRRLHRRNLAGGRRVLRLVPVHGGQMSVPVIAEEAP